MIIAIEGPDNGGKTTLVKRIRARTSTAAFVSMLGGRTEPIAVMRKRTYDAIWTYGHERRSDALLTERFHPISDLVYRTVFGGERGFSKHEYDGLCESLRSSGSRVIYCRPSVETAIKSAHHPAGDDTPEWCSEIEASMHRLFEEYDRVMLDLAWARGVTVIPYDHASSIAPALEDSICAAFR